MSLSFLKQNKFHISALVFANILLTDFNIPTYLKVVLSVLPFFILFYLYFFSSKRLLFYKLIIVYTFSFPFGPRDIEGFFGGEVQGFVSYVNLNVGFLSLSLFTLIFFTIIESHKLGELVNLLRSFVLFFFPLIAYSFILSSNEGFYLNFFISDLKPFILFFFGVFFGKCLWKRYHKDWNFYFREVYTFLLFVYLFKTIYYIASDFISSNNVYNFSTLPYLFIPIVFMAFFSVRKDKKKTLFLIFAAFISSFNISRGFFIMVGALAIIVPFLYANRSNINKVIRSYFLLIGLFVFIMFMGGLFLSETAYIFLQYKLNFFTTEIATNSSELNRSTTIRLYEFKNIFYELINNPIKLIFGKGLGSYFEFKEASLPVALDVDAFSIDQIRLNKFFRPHTFFNVALLKGGFLLLTTSLFVVFKILKKSSKLSKLDNNNEFYMFSGIFSILFIFFFWIPEFLFLSGLIFGYFKSIK